MATGLKYYFGIELCLSQEEAMISSKRKVIGELKTDKRVEMAFSSPKDKEEQESICCLLDWLFCKIVI